MADYGIPQPDVGLTHQPTPYLQDSSNPAAFGAGVAGALGDLAGKVTDIAAHERRMKASFDAADAELSYGTKLDQLGEQYKNDLKKLAPEDGQSYQDAVTALHQKYAGDAEQLRADQGVTLKDPLALKNYAIRTRLQTQTELRRLGTLADAQVQQTQHDTATSLLDAATRRAGNVTGNVQTDLLNLQTQAIAGLKPIEDVLAANGRAGEIPKVRAEAEGKMVSQALTAYDKGPDMASAQAGLAFLRGTLPGTEITVGFDPAHPERESVLNGAETAKWVEKYQASIDNTKTAKSADVGLAFAARNWEGMSYGTFKAEARKTFLDGSAVDAKAYDSALTNYSKYRGEAHADLMRNRVEATKQAADAVIKYGGMEGAEAAGAIPPNADRSQLISVDTRFNTYAAKPIIAKVGGALGDPQNSGWSSAVSMDDFTTRLYSAHLPEAQIAKFQGEYRKDAARTVALDKSPGANVALGNVRDTLRATLGVSQVTGKGLSDLKQQWQRDVVTAAEVELYHRIANATPKTGTKTIPQEDAIRIAQEVGKMIPDLKDRARAGESVIPNYPPPPSQPTDAAKLAAARVITSLGGASTGEVAELTPDQYEAAPSGTKYRVPGKPGIHTKP